MSSSKSYELVELHDPVRMAQIYGNCIAYSFCHDRVKPCMPRCRKILNSGLRCKAHAISGSKFCLFHTPGKGMRGSGKRKKPESPKNQTSNRLPRILENQIIGRSSKGLGRAMQARGAFLMSNRSLYTVTYRNNPARYNVQGTRYVGAHVQKTIEMTPADGGRGFLATETKKNPRGMPHHAYMGRRIYSWGRIIPVLGFGAVMYNTLSGQQQYEPRKGEGFWQAAALYAMEDAAIYADRHGIGKTIDTAGKPFNISENFKIMKEVKPFWK